MNGKMTFQLGRLKADIAGGPYRSKPDAYHGVKMAEEIDLPCLIDIPTQDFSVPDVHTFKQGLLRGVSAVHLGLPLYVGCMGGIGRTGLYMAGMAKVMTEYRKKMHRSQFDPILYVRNEYIPHAVETPEQMRFIRDLDVSDIVEWWHMTQRMMYGGMIPEVAPAELSGDDSGVVVHHCIVPGCFNESNGKSPVCEGHAMQGGMGTEEYSASGDPLFAETCPPGKCYHYGEGYCLKCGAYDQETDSRPTLDGPVDIRPAAVIRDAELLEDMEGAKARIKALADIADGQGTRVQLLQDCVSELNRRMTRMEAARNADLKKCAANCNKRWWQFWK